MTEPLLNVIDSFAALRVLVIGEAMLDSYLIGTATRVCREAPVPIVALGERRDVPGGAANAAVNVASLGGNAAFLSAIGDDIEGALLRDALEASGVPTDTLLIEEGRRTLTKHRVVAASQVLVRFDQGDTDAICRFTEDALIARLHAHFPHCDAVLISDYGYGILTPRVVHELTALQHDRPCPVIVDAKELTRYRALCPTAIKPSYEEATRLLQRDHVEDSSARADWISAQGERLLDLTGARIAAVTLDTDGAVVIQRGLPAYRIAARPSTHARAIGAGDTFVGALALALAAGADAHAASDIASAAAAIAVSVDGTTACTRDALREQLAESHKYAPDSARLLRSIAWYRAHGKRIVFTNGCFDILHRGHVALLNRARALGDLLVVGINTDESVARLKGPHRPINSLDDRAQVLAGLGCVDYVVPFTEETPESLIRAIRPDIFVKGGDYTRETLPETAIVESLGGTVHILPFIADRSTTRVIERIQGSGQRVAGGGQ
jgi:D-beta-D-heptose 7-phosphate kinase/D-beta-D-heptose 1-phosphate adenosyltransferase